MLAQPILNRCKTDRGARAAGRGWVCGQMVTFCDGPHILCFSEGAHKQSVPEISAEEPLSVCICIASTALVGDEAELSACALGFSRPVLLTARGGKELDPLRAKSLKRAVGDPGGVVQTK